MLSGYVISCTLSSCVLSRDELCAVWKLRRLYAIGICVIETYGIGMCYRDVCFRAVCY